MVLGNEFHEWKLFVTGKIFEQFLEIFVEIKERSR